MLLERSLFDHYPMLPSPPNCDVQIRHHVKEEPTSLPRRQSLFDRNPTPSSPLNRRVQIGCLVKAELASPLRSQYERFI